MADIKTTRGPIEFIEVLTGDYGKSVHISQEVTKVYPAGQGGNSKSVAVFASEKFGDGQEFTTARHMLVKAPKAMADSKIKSDFLAWLKANPNACIYRVLSHDVKDVLTEEQLSYGKSLEEYREDLEVKDSNGNSLKGTPQYRQYFLSEVTKADEDFRGVNRSTVKVASKEEVVEELAS